MSAGIVVSSIVHLGSSYFMYGTYSSSACLLDSKGAITAACGVLPQVDTCIPTASEKSSRRLLSVAESKNKNKTIERAGRTVRPCRKDFMTL